MADIIELIVADHDRIRRLLSAVDDTARYQDDVCTGWPLVPVWRRFAELAELHFAAEEEICYLPAFGSDAAGIAGMQDAIADHDDIREAITETRLAACGSPAWWLAICAARGAALDHMTREERGVLASFSARVTPQTRRELGRDWARFLAARTRDGKPARHQPRPWPARASGITGGAGGILPGRLSGLRSDRRPPSGPSGYGPGRTG